MKGWHRATNKPKGKCADLTLAPRGQIRPPTPILRWAARCACGLRPAPRALLRGGFAAPDPQGCAPVRLRARAPAASVTQPEGFRARVRRWRGWATACGCPCPTPSPWRFSGFWEISKSWAARSAAGGFGGRAPRCRAAVGNPAQAVGGQGAAAGCARRPRTGRGCPRATGPRGSALDH